MGAGMRVILLQDVVHQGMRGDEIEVKPGYARNYLIPQGLALESTKANRNYFDQIKKKVEVQNRREREVAEERAKQFEGVELTLLRRVSEGEELYGAVTAAEIVDALGEKGIEVDRKLIDLEGGITEIGEHQVRLMMHPDVIPEITVKVEVEE